MPLKPYLKLYTLLLGALLVVLLLGYGLVLGLNSVRHQAYLEHQPEPLLNWLSLHPDLVHTVLPRGLPGHWSLVQADQLELDPVTRERLQYGQVLIEERSDGLRWLYRLRDGSLLRLAVRDPYRDLSEIQAGLFAGMVEGGRVKLEPEVLAAFGHYLGMHRAQLVTSADQIPDQSVLDSIADSGRAFYQPGSGDAAQVFWRLGSDGKAPGQILKMTMDPPFNPWGWPILTLVLLIAAGTLALLVYAFLSRLHQRLASIENVVARIARGELDARVRLANEPVVEGLGEAFNRMADHIQRLVGVQREMIHAVSHELRTPVARIRFGVQMLDDGEDDPGRSKQLMAIDNDIQELDELIDEILTYARLEQGGPVFSLQEVDVARVVDQVVGEQQVTRPDLSIEADYRGEPAAWSLTDAEPRYLHRAIQNLVGNATRYARNQIRVVCSFDEHTCRVDVEDDGPGIPEEDWDRVFTAFARLDDSRTRKSGGYGLGLSIVRRILFWHGGQAFVGRSESLGGARFSLVWPRRQAESA